MRFAIDIYRYSIIIKNLKTIFSNFIEQKLRHLTVGTYFIGNSPVAYVINIHVLPNMEICYVSFIS